MESSQYNRTSDQYSQRTLSPTNSRDMYANNSNTVPVYRHGRKFYVSMEEFERMRADERRHRRTVLQRSQNLPVSKSHSINYRPPSASLYNPIHRSTSNPQGHQHGVLKTPHLPANATHADYTNLNRNDPTRQSRSTLRFYDDRDEKVSVVSALPVKLPTTTVRSNSSDKILDFRRTPQLSIIPSNDYTPNDYELKRSVSAEIVQPTSIQLQQPQVIPRRIIPTATSDFSMSTAPTYPQTPTDQTYNQSNASKLTSYFNRRQPSTMNPPVIPPTSTMAGTNPGYEASTPDTEHVYSVLGASNRRTGPAGVTTVLSRSPTHNSNYNKYIFRDQASGSLSDENSSSPSMLIQRRNPDHFQTRRTPHLVETDENYGQQNESWTRPTARSHSNEGLTEKKRVRFADMEGFTLETVPDLEQQRSPMNNRLLTRRPYDHISSHFQGQVQPFYNSLYQTTARVGGEGSKLATDV